MRPTLNEEIEFALWKITGMAIPYNEHVIPTLSQELARQTGGDPGEVSMRLSARIKEIIQEDISQLYRTRVPCKERS
jgi:hypothetical protein